MVTYLESDILECEVKQALGSITTNKASWGDGIPAELIQILKNDAVKVLHSVCQQHLENSAVATGLEKVSFHSNPKEGQCSNYRTIAFILHPSKVMLKILQARLQQYMNWELPDVQAGFRKGRETRDQIANIRWLMEKAMEFQKNIYFCFTDYLKDFVWKILRRWEYQTTLPASWETCMQIKKQQLEPDMEQRAGSKLGKEYN